MKRLADIGERGAIRRIESILKKGNNTLGIGDDCAAIDMGNHYLLVTTDMMFQRTHIPPQMTPYQMGWFLVAINLSDIAAKGGTPLGVVCSFGLPKKTSEGFLRQLAKGADTCATCFGTTIMGGDTKETAEITLCGTAFGTVEKDVFMPRIGMRPGDVVALTGSLGKAAAGHYALQKNKQEKKLSKALLEPQPRIREGKLLAMQHSVSSSMDISDGLSASLYQLGEVNAVGFEIQKQALPVAEEVVKLAAKDQRIDPFSLALHFGGDYELLVTIPFKKFQHTQKSLRKKDVPLTAIGVVTKKKRILLIDRGKKTPLENKGYEHFKTHQY